MAYSNEGPQGPSLSKEMEKCARMTTRRNRANDTLLAWIALKRCCDGLAVIYDQFPDEKSLVSWLKTGAQMALEREGELEAIVNGYDEKLTVLTAKIRQEYLGDEQL